MIAVGASLAQPATVGTGNSVIDDSVGDVGASPAYVDIEMTRITQTGQGRIVFVMELAGPVMPASGTTVLYTWFIDDKRANNGLLDPEDFSVNLLFDGKSWATSFTKANEPAQPITGAANLGVSSAYDVSGATVRVYVNFADMMKLQQKDPSLDAKDFYWWGATRYGTVSPPNADRAPSVPRFRERRNGCIETSLPCDPSAWEGCHQEYDGRRKPHSFLFYSWFDCVNQAIE